MKNLKNSAVKTFRQIPAAIVLSFSAICISFAQTSENELKIPPEVTPFVENETKAIALEKADLNGDGTQDFILVLEDLKNESEDEKGKRSLLVLTRGADDKLTLAKRNDKGVVYCRTCGGIFGDPFDGVIAGTKTFSVELYGGSAWRWKMSYKFNYSRIDRTWQLDRVIELSYHTSDPNKVKTRTHTPPRDFGKIDIADFDPQNYLKKAAKQKNKN
ncbi:MAG: hypothetical protein M3209_14515 [Acidobacteriota bacterium]|nr:hypothetical protein [Acidobacteriota bacterium]